MLSVLFLSNQRPVWSHAPHPSKLSYEVNIGVNLALSMKLPLDLDTAGF